MKAKLTLAGAAILALTATATAHPYQPSEWNYRYPAWRQSQFEAPRHRHARRHRKRHWYVRRYRHHHYRHPHRNAFHGLPRGRGNLMARSGATASVSNVALPHFQCFIGKLENVGYHIFFMGGFGYRPNASAHPTGNALDVNQCSRNVVRTRCHGGQSAPFPFGTVAMAHACGLKAGSEFRHSDTGHFEMANRYGYVYPSGRRYAARHRHVRLAWNEPHRRSYHHRGMR